MEQTEQTFLQQRSLRIAHIEPSVTLAVSTKAKMMQKEGIRVVDLSAGETDFPPPTGAIKAVQAVLKGKHLLARYTPTLGIPELRETIAKQYSKKTKETKAISQNNIAVSAGAKQALYNSIAVLCNPNDEVLIPAPIWITYAEQVKLCDGKPVFCKTEEERFAVKADLLRERISSKTKAIILNSPCNPTGAIIPQSELKRIADVALEHKLWLISDEVYEPFVYESYEGGFSSVAGLGQEVFEKSIIISAASKMFSMTGWRLGYAVAPEPLIKAMDALQGHTTSNACSLAQYAVLGALQDARTKKYVQTMRNEFKKRREVMIKRLNQMDLSCQKPGGAFFAFADITRTHLGSVVLCKELLQNAHVACVPGKAFGSDKHIRLSYATSMDEIKKGMDQIEKWLNGGVKGERSPRH